MSKKPNLTLVPPPLGDDPQSAIAVLAERVRGAVELLITAQDDGAIEATCMLTKGGLSGVLHTMLGQLEAIEELADSLPGSSAASQVSA